MFSTDFYNQLNVYQENAQLINNPEYAEIITYWKNKENLSTNMFLPQNNNSIKTLPNEVVEHLHKNNLFIDANSLKKIDNLTKDDKYFVKTLLKNMENCQENNGPITLLKNDTSKSKEA